MANQAYEAAKNRKGVSNKMIYVLYLIEAIQMKISLYDLQPVCPTCGS